MTDGDVGPTTGWIVMTFCTGILGPQWMNPTGVGDNPTFHLAPPACQRFRSSSEIF